MDAELKEICDLMLVNYEELRSTVGEKKEAEFLLTGANVFTAELAHADGNDVKTAMEIIKERMNVLEQYSNKVEFFLECKMSRFEDPEEYIEEVVDICRMIQTGKRVTENNNILSAMMIIDNAIVTGACDYEEMASKAKDVFMALSDGEKGHEGELPFATAAALCGLDGEYMTSREPELRDYLRKGIKLDHITVDIMGQCVSLINGDVRGNYDRFSRIASALKKEKHSVGQGKINLLLAQAAGFGIDEGDLVQSIIEADDYLKQHKPFKGIMGLEAEFRRFIAILCVIRRLDETEGLQSRMASIMGVYITILNATRTF